MIQLIRILYLSPHFSSVYIGQNSKLGNRQGRSRQNKESREAPLKLITESFSEGVVSIDKIPKRPSNMTRKNPQEMSMRKSLVFQYRNDSVEQKGRK